MAVLACLVCILISVFLLAYTFCNRNFNYWKSRGVPNITPEFIYGNSKGLGTEYHTSDFMKRVYNEFKDKGPFGGVHISFRPTAIITDLDLIRNVLVKDFKYFPNRGIYYNKKHDPISEHVSNIENEQWKNIRSKLTPTFTSGKLKTMLGSILDISQKFMSTIEKESESHRSLEIKDVLSRFTCDVIGNVAFGLECDSLDNKDSKLYKMAVKSMDSFDFVQRLVLMGYKDIARALRIKLMPSDASEFFINLVKSIVDYRRSNKDEKRGDLMNILIGLMDREDLSMNQITAQSFFYFLAGYETTSTTLTFAIYELSQHQEIQEKARQEGKSILIKYQDQLTYEAVSELNYIDQVIRETLRKWPPSASVQRESVMDYKAPNTNYVIDKGCAIMVPVYGIHHDESIYPEPEKFDPSRFDSNNVEKRHPYAFLPFGDGPRACPGIRFSMLETKICLAKLLLRFQFSLDLEQTEFPIKISPTKFMMCPENGVFVKFIKI